VHRASAIRYVCHINKKVGGMPKEEIEKKCGTCKYFRFGLWCYRYPQIAKKNKNDYCGEWEKK